MDCDTAILVCSCDKYEDVWGPFFTLLFRYWPDCRYPVYLLANDKSYPDPRVQTLHTPVGSDWSSSFVQALDCITSKRVLVVMEDYLVLRAVDGARVDELIRIMEEENAACVHLFPDPIPRRRHLRHVGLGYVEPGQPFRVNLQVAVWDRPLLRSLAKAGENAWDFEVLGSGRSDSIDRPFLSLTCKESDAPFCYYRTGVVRGEWMPGALRLCEREGIALDLTRRRVGWVRGYIRDSKLLYPIRVGFVRIKRWLGEN